MDFGKKGKSRNIAKTLLHTPACSLGSRAVSAGPGRIACVCDFSPLCPRKEGVRGGLRGGHREHIVPGVLLQCKPGFSHSGTDFATHAENPVTIRFFLGHRGARSMALVAKG